MTGCAFTFNSGVSNCDPIADVGKMFVAVPTFKADGSRNEILAGVTLDEAFFTARYNDPDPQSRWYPFQLSDNLEDIREVAIQETLGSGVVLNVQKGQRSVDMVMVGVSPIYAGKIDEIKNGKFSFFLYTKSSQVVGAIDITGTKLRPFRINERSFQTIVGKTQETVAAKIQVMFQYNVLEADKNIRVIEPEQIADFDVLESRGLLDVTGIITVPIAASFVIDLTEDYGPFPDKNVASGWVPADFVVFNVTDSLAVPITSAVETPALSGSYLVTFTSVQTVGKVLSVNDAKDGFELREATMTISV